MDPGCPKEVDVKGLANSREGEGGGTSPREKQGRSKTVLWGTRSLCNILLVTKPMLHKPQQTKRGGDATSTCARKQSLRTIADCQGVGRISRGASRGARALQ